MGKYSSDSDSSDYRKKRSGRSRYRHSDSDSSGSSYHRRYKSKHKSKSRKHSRSRDRYRKSSNRDTSRTRSVLDKRDKRSRSYDRRSKSRERRSRDRRSRSRDSRYSKTVRSGSSSREHSRKPNNFKVFDLTSDNEESQPKMSNADLDIEAKLKQKFSATTTDFDIEEDVVEEPIDADKFLQFSSGAKKVPDNIVIDLKSQTILVPKIEVAEEKLTIFHPNLIPNEELRIEKWIKDLYSYRQKALRGEIKI